MKRARPGWMLYWLAGLVLIGFGVPETIAIVSGCYACTFTATVRTIATVPVVWFLLAGLFAWLIPHFLGPRARAWIWSWKKRSS